MAGSTRQQTVGRINQVADSGDGDGDEDGDDDEDEDEDKDEIPNYAVLLTRASLGRRLSGRTQVSAYFKK